METFYFGANGQQLYGVLHQEARSSSTAGVVFCPPFGEEMTTTYARLARWSKQLAKKGIGVLRFHPYGTGDSEGKFSDFTLQSAVRDAAVARDFARKRISGKLGYFGLRFGASSAMLAAQSEPADFLILWSPIVDLKQYFRELLRIRIAKEMVHQQRDRVRMTTQQMIDGLEAGVGVDLFGYELSPSLYRQMTASEGWAERPPALHILWLARPNERSAALPIVERWKAGGSQVDLQILRVPPFWEDFSSLFPEELADSTQSWLNQLVRTS